MSSKLAIRRHDEHERLLVEGDIDEAGSMRGEGHEVDVDVPIPESFDEMVGLILDDTRFEFRVLFLQGGQGVGKDIRGNGGNNADGERPSKGAVSASGVVVKSIRCFKRCLLYTSPSPRDGLLSRMPSSA